MNKKTHKRALAPVSKALCSKALEAPRANGLGRSPALTQEDRNKRRALIVRRWGAYRTSQAQLEIWRRRREAQAAEGDEEVGRGALFTEIPNDLRG